jgi:intracellular multiplication protein IcmQ
MDERKKYNLELIRGLDKLIAEGQWDGGLFFQAAGKKLRDLSEKLKKELQLEGNEDVSATEMKDLVKQHSGLIEIYISLYNADGRNIKKWEVVLASLAKQLVSRPIYKKEKDIKDSIATKENPINDAYAVAYISEMDILTPSFRDKKPIDRFGHELLVLKENSLKLENITKLVHLTGEYSYRKGLLTKIT